MRQPTYQSHIKGVINDTCAMFSHRLCIFNHVIPILDKQVLRLGNR